MKRALVKLPDTADPASMPAVRNRAADIVIRASSFLRHCSFRHSSLRSFVRTVQVGSSEQVQYYHKNYLDHVYAITDASGDALEHIRYTAFGFPQHYDFAGLKVATSPTGNQFLWNAKENMPGSQ